MYVLSLLVGCFVHHAVTEPTSDLRCNVRVHIDSGWVCGLLREAECGVKYASFRGIPYGQQPLGKLRFKELQPIKPWHHVLDATEEGPICPQHDELYGRLMKPVNGMSESCIYVNVHVPVEALPKIDRTDKLDYLVNGNFQPNGKVGYPILVFIHGGAYTSGSGDSDLHGPEYLISKGIIVITFNYRINVFGFLSLNTPKIPGNAGLRDQVTLLRWVQRNARVFGGDPYDVTLGGHSAGAASVHLLALSKETKNLFKRVLIMSSSLARYTTSPVYASQIAAKFLKAVEINTTDPDLIHDQLIKMPLEKIVNTFSEFQYDNPSGPFTPVVEAKYPGVTRIVDDDPISTTQRGRDKDYPMLIGFANNESEFFKYRLRYLSMLSRIKEDPVLILPPRIQYSTSRHIALRLAKMVIQKYFHGKLNYDDYLEVFTESLFQYPAFQLVRWRGETRSAPSYLYQFSYDSDHSVLKKTLKLQYKGSAHAEDLSYLFRVNSVLGREMSFPPKNKDDRMKDWMTTSIVNFMRCNDPSCGEDWFPVDPHILNYQLVSQPGVYMNTQPSYKEWDMIHFYDRIDQITRNSSIQEYQFV